jgi:hypothetical protein
VRSARFVAYTDKIINAFKISTGKPEGKIPQGHLGVDGIIITETIIKKENDRMLSGLF